MQIDPTRWKNIGIAAGLLLSAAALRLYGIDWALPDVFEEATPLRRAWGMWGWGPQRSFDPNPHFFNYPSLVIYVQFGGQLMLLALMKLFGVIGSILDFRSLYIVDPTAFYVVGRAITSLFGLGTVWFVYFIGLRIGGRTAAIPAALLVALNAVHISNSQMVSVDVPLTFFVTAFFWAALRILDAPTHRNYLVAGVLLGLATSTKYTGALLVVSLLAVHLVALGREKGKSRPNWNLLGAAVVAAVIAFYATSPFVLLDSGAFRHDLATEREHMRLGHFGLDGSAAWLYYARALSGKVLGWPAAILALLGLGYFAAIRRSPWALVLAAFVIAYGVAIASWSMRAERYLLPVVPLAILFAGAFIRVVISARPVSQTISLVAAAMVTLLLAGPVVADYPSLFDRLKPDPRSQARRWIEENIPHGSLVVSEPYGPSLVGPLQLWSDSSDISAHVVWDDRVALYAVQMLPMYQVHPERSAVFYDVRLYRAADLIVTSSIVRSRYVREPARFPRQAAFYDSLEAGFDLLAQFRAPSGPGPTVTVYGNTKHNVPFSQRERAEDPPQLQPSQTGAYGGEEGFFYYNWGLNYATFADPKQAIECYQMALNHPILPEGRHVAVVGRMVASLRDAGLHKEASRFLARAEVQALTPAARERLRALR